VLKLTGENLKETLNNYVDVLSEKLDEKNEIEEVDLESTLHEVLQSINSSIQTAKATIHTDFSEVGTVSFNRSYLVSIFLNLITNAIKYARQDRAPVISIYTKKAADGPQLVVSDNGQGFDMEEAKGKLFQKNQTFHNHKDSKGIGLYLVYNHITSLGGTIDFYSKVNEGTTFTITFKQ
jgi:signal transduction histidine kinase